MVRSLSRPLHLLSLFTFAGVVACSSNDATVHDDAAGGASGQGGNAPTGGASGTSGGSSSGGGTLAGSGGSGGVVAGSGGAGGVIAGSGGAGGVIAGSGGAGATGGATGGSSGSGGAKPDAATGGASGTVIDSGPGLDVNPPVSGIVVPLDIPKDGIVALMKRAADWGHANITTYSHNMTTGNDWATGAFYTGITAVWRTTNEATYRNWVIEWGNNNQWKPKTVTPDDTACIQTFCEAYVLEPDAANAGRYTPSKTMIDAELAKNPSGSGWFWWEDGLYMGPAGISMLGAITGQTSYFDQVTRIWFEATGAYCQQDTQLCFWKKEWIYPGFQTPKGNPALWGPGNAWVIGGMIRSMKYLPQNYPNRQKWIASFQTMANSLRLRQQPDGAWRTNLYEPTEFPDPESGSTSFFTYAMALGMLYGWLDQPTYMPVVKKSWAWLTTIIDANGKVGRCQPWSNQPGVAGLTNNTPEGQGAFMLAGEGMYLLATR